MLAQSNFHYTVKFALIEAGADVDKEKIEVEDLFFRAIEEKRATTVRILLARWGSIARCRIAMDQDRRRLRRRMMMLRW